MLNLIKNTNLKFYTGQAQQKVSLCVIADK